LSEVIEANPLEAVLVKTINEVRASLMLAGFDHAQIGKAMLTSGGALLAYAKGREACVQSLTELADDLANGFATIN
jgi:hypothetical protein